ICEEVHAADYRAADGHRIPANHSRYHRGGYFESAGRAVRGPVQADGESVEQHSRPVGWLRSLPLAQVRSDFSAGLLPDAFHLHDILYSDRLAAAAEPVSLECFEGREGRDRSLQRGDRSSG